MSDTPNPRCQCQCRQSAHQDGTGRCLGTISSWPSWRYCGCPKFRRAER